VGIPILVRGQPWRLHAVNSAPCHRFADKALGVVAKIVHDAHRAALRQRPFDRPIDRLKVGLMPETDLHLSRRPPDSVPLLENQLKRSSGRSILERPFNYGSWQDPCFD
jgi:hypothetical protein